MKKQKTVACQNCGEELMGAVNKCWRCGSESNSSAESIAEPVVRQTWTETTNVSDVAKYTFPADTGNPYTAPVSAVSDAPKASVKEFAGEYAGLRRRFVASMFDTLMITGIVFAFHYFYLGLDAVISRQFPTPTAQARIDFLMHRSYVRSESLLLYLLYCVVTECSPMQGTFGKWLMGIRVVDNYGQRLSFARSLGRSAAKIISQAPLSLGYLWAVWSERNRTWHDIIARTLVVTS